jgi:hypothetical protein
VWVPHRSGFKGAAFALLWLSELARQSELILAHPWHKSSNSSMASLGRVARTKWPKTN